ncbi:MAG: tRNA (guanosine(37)-N1)-methyltransferase TrmD [Sphaerochaetaceae bacterium]|jgi:tRNA (guanine37-N1)-methyltransferase|nr:tRNA (guanosine(37)-N1)-methyltransferase TrmD [Sphaerochaetaceae bacterium]MDD2406139.1 tRNA (guanosine(37)-N1)-methyltransferase TrmD [Sphaerochaetaceae bacterium]MDD3671142.1 tRNA (guanosine(37)-N1)-methyltransferase TrmD [Sphaerochaetaceae bacterium]MDD4259068.1 tRNA (guanosine(37)-N1)-methyltransferase TrmD [Sphaerochaetaceae bacterium]
MKFSILTLFPEIIESFFTTSIMARSVACDTISYDVVNFRDYATDKHKTCDDAPYGGGAGMVLKPEPLGSALDAIQAKNKRVIYPTPSGKRFTQAYARELSKEDQLVIICGRYEGIDQRIIDLYVDDEICIGDYVISSGEVAALVIVDAVYRLVDGVISDESLEEESFTDGLLEYPQYTRPATYCGIDVPEILLSGHHAQIGQWRFKKRLEKTFRNRPELLQDMPLDENSKRILEELKLYSAKGTEDYGCDQGN